MSTVEQNSLMRALHHSLSLVAFSLQILCQAMLDPHLHHTRPLTYIGEDRKVRQLKHDPKYKSIRQTSQDSMITCQRHSHHKVFVSVITIDVAY